MNERKIEMSDAIEMSDPVAGPDISMKDLTSPASLNRVMGELPEGVDYCKLKEKGTQSLLSVWRLSLLTEAEINSLVRRPCSKFPDFSGFMGEGKKLGPAVVLVEVKGGATQAARATLSTQSGRHMIDTPTEDYKTGKPIAIIAVSGWKPKDYKPRQSPPAP